MVVEPTTFTPTSQWPWPNQQLKIEMTDAEDTLDTLIPYGIVVGHLPSTPFNSYDDRGLRSRIERGNQLKDGYESCEVGPTLHIKDPAEISVFDDLLKLSELQTGGYGTNQSKDVSLFSSS